MVAIWTLAGEGEVFGKEMVSRARKDFASTFLFSDSFDILGDDFVG
jgi:hypothetical protein